jgi:GNAT superfamily N-acetyltransferase
MNLNTIDYVVFDKMIKRGTAKILEDTDNALFLYDTKSEGYYLACEDVELGMSILDKYVDRDFHLLMVTNILIGEKAYEKYGFDGKYDCYQFAYYGKDVDEDSSITTRTATKEDIPFLLDNYDLISSEEIIKLVSLGNIELAYVGDNLVGFMGEHLEGSMGLLYILPEYRRKGYASALEKRLIKMTLEKGFTPYGHVVKDNIASIELQKRLGFEQSTNLIRWMWK